MLVLAPVVSSGRVLHTRSCAWSGLWGCHSRGRFGLDDCVLVRVVPGVAPSPAVACLRVNSSQGGASSALSVPSLVSMRYGPSLAGAGTCTDRPLVCTWPFAMDEKSALSAEGPVFIHSSVFKNKNDSLCHQFLPNVF